MRYAILSDIHSNLEALTAVLDALASQRIDRFLILGDVVGYGADPVAVLAKLQALDSIAVAGNHDWACIGKFNVHQFNRAAKDAVLWTRDRLGFSELDWIRRMPLTATEGPCTLVHGTHTHPERFDYLMDLAQAVDIVTMSRTPYALLGHTHMPLLFEYDMEARKVLRMLTDLDELREVRLAAGDARVRYILNPGSVGQPRDGDPRASFAVLDDGERVARFARVTYDVDTAQRKIRAAGLPEFLAERLAVGR